MSAQGIFCPFCHSDSYQKYGKNRQRRQRYKCGSCGKMFTSRTGKITHGSHISDKQWQTAIELFCLRSAISGADLAKLLKVNVKTACKMLRILRQLCKQLEPEVLPGITEWDETTARKKTWIHGGVSRLIGKCLLRYVPNREQATLIPYVLAHTEPGYVRCTDEWLGYKDMPERLSVCHAEEFVASYCSAVHTNTQEGVWGHMKPMGIHVYRGFPRETLDEFLSEVMFRYNYKDYSHRVKLLTALLKRKTKTNSL